MERSKSKRSQNPLKGKSIFLESDVKRSSSYRDLLKHLTFLGAKVEEYLTPSISFVVTKDHAKCGGPNTSHDSPNAFASPPSAIIKSPSKGAMFESRAQKQLRLAREKSETSKHPVATMPVAKTRKSTNRERIQKYYHMDRFVKWVRRHYVAQRRSSNEHSPLITTGSPKPVNYKPISPTKPISPQKARLFSSDRFPVEPRNLHAPFLKIVDISSCFRPIVMEQFQPPVLTVSPVENNGCPFVGFDKRTERKRRRTSKDSKPKKGGSCEICDTKFEDENVHFESPRHQQCLQSKRGEFVRIQGFCKLNFPNTPLDLLKRLAELNNQKKNVNEAQTVLKTHSEHVVKKQTMDVSLLSPTGNNDFTKLRQAENALTESCSSSDKKTSKSTGESNLNESVDWLSKELTEQRESPETAKRGKEVTQVLGILSLEKSDPTDMKRKATPSKGTYNPTQLLPDDDDRDSKSPIIFSIMQRSLAVAEEVDDTERSPIILSKFAPPLPIDIETRSPALKKACIQQKDGTHLPLETARNLRTDLLKTINHTVPNDPHTTPPRHTNESPPLPAPVLSAVVVSPKELKSSPKTLTMLERCTESSLISIDELASDRSMHNGSIEVITPDDQEVQAILHADGSEFKTPQKPKPSFDTPPPNEEDDLAHIDHFMNTPENIRSSSTLDDSNYLTLPPRKASFEDNAEVELVDDNPLAHYSTPTSQLHCDGNLDIIVSKSKLTKIPVALKGLDFSDIIFQTSPGKGVRKSKRNAKHEIESNPLQTSKPSRSPTLTEENGVFTLEAFAQELSSSDDEVSYSNYNRRIQRRRTQKDAEKAISGQTEYDALFESGSINNQTQLHCAVDEQVFVDNLTPESKKVFFEAYSFNEPSLDVHSSPEYCPKRPSSRRAKQIQNPSNHSKSAKRPQRQCRTRASPKYKTIYGFDSSEDGIGYNMSGGMNAFHLYISDK